MLTVGLPEKKTKKNFIVYKDQCFGYFQIVRDLAQKSIADARREVQATNNYITNGDVS